MTRSARTALHSEAVRLVEHHHILVLVKNEAPDERGVPVIHLRASSGGVFGGRFAERRNPHALPGLEPRLRLGAGAIDAHLARAQDFLKLAEAERRIACLQETVEPEPVLAVLHRDDFNGHVTNPQARPAARPSTKAPSDRRTETAT